MVRCAREDGLSTVLEALMTFKGPEFYFAEWPELFGLSFKEIFTRFEGAVPVGVCSLAQLQEILDGQLMLACLLGSSSNGTEP